MGNYTVKEVASKIDHAVLKPDATEQDVRDNAKMCIEQGVASMCVRPCDVKLTAGLLKDSPVMTSCVLSFPHGADATPVKAFQARQAIEDGPKYSYCDSYCKLCYSHTLNTRQPDYLREGLLEFLQKGPKNLDECVVEGGKVMKRMGFKGSSRSDDFRIRVFEKLHQLKAVGYVTKDRSVKPPLFAAVSS